MTAFGSFRLDPANKCLWQKDSRIPMAPKLFSVLCHLVENPGRLVSQEELLEAVWPETFVQPQVRRKYIQELRKILGDSAQTPVYLETIPKRGYRFRLPLTAGASPAETAIASVSLVAVPQGHAAPPGRAAVL